MKKTITLICLFAGLFFVTAQEKQVLNIIAIGAHPDDCDSKFGGTAALYAKMGHNVKFLALTNGDAAHQTMGGGALGKRRRSEALEAGKILGVTYDVLDHHEGELIPSVHIRQQVIRKIREWNADIVLSLRPSNYDADHRNAGVLVQDAASLVVVPNITPDTPALKKSPVFLYMNDHFKKPYPFSKDISVIIDKVIDQKVRGMAAHESQMFEWLPWLNGTHLDFVPKGKEERINWLTSRWVKDNSWDQKELNVILKWYPSAIPSKVKQVEFFEICEFGAQPTEEEIKLLFPMLGMD